MLHVDAYTAIICKTYCVLYLLYKMVMCLIPQIVVVEPEVPAAEATEEAPVEDAEAKTGKNNPPPYCPLILPLS